MAAKLARVGDPTVLKAELRIAETQAKGRADRTGRVGRHAERRDSGPCGAHRPGGGERDGDSGRDAEGSAAAGRASGPVCARPAGPPARQPPRDRRTAKVRRLAPKQPRYVL